MVLASRAAGTCLLAGLNFLFYKHTCMALIHGIDARVWYVTQTHVYIKEVLGLTWHAYIHRTAACSVEH